MKEDALKTIKYILSNTYEQYVKDITTTETSREATNVKVLISDLHKSEQNNNDKAIYKKLKKHYTKVAYG